MNELYNIYLYIRQLRNKKRKIISHFTMLLLQFHRGKNKFAKLVHLFDHFIKREKYIAPALNRATVVHPAS